MIALLALAAVLGQARVELPQTIASKHYDLRSSATKEESQELLDFMELVHQTYTALLKPDNLQDLDRKRFTIHLYKDMEEYVKSGAPPGSGAYYDPNTKLLVGWYDTTFMKPFFAHEGMHQFTDATSKNFFNFNMWFTEGIADCIGNCEVRGKKLYMCVKSGMIARMRLQTVQAGIRGGGLPRLERLMSLNKQVFMANAELCYAMSWSFCHFLITFPKDEDRNVQIPDGKYRKNLAGYYELMRQGGVSHDRAWAEAFKGIPMEELEEQWKKYVLGLDSGRFMGIRAHELTAEELAKQAGPIDAGYSGILIEEAVAEGAAAKGGIQNGDVIVKFDGKRFPKHDAMNRLRVWMQDVPYGRQVKVIVLRGGKEVECSCKWDPPKK